MEETETKYAVLYSDAVIGRKGFYEDVPAK